MRDDLPAPPPRPRPAVILKGLKPEQVDPDFKGTPLEFTRKYGHVLLQTKDQIEHHKRQETLMTWIGTLPDLDKAARTMLATIGAVDPAAMRGWLAKPGKTEKFRAWRKNVQAACEALGKIEADD
jgi:hypothetical protein